MNLKEKIRHVPDFPKPGILFYDISTLLADAVGWAEAVKQLSDMIAAHKPDVLVGIESRGFLVAAPVAVRLECGFVMARKKGKLPGSVIQHHYDLEYGTDTLEVQDDILTPGQRVVIVDDLLATGGTAEATVALVRKVGGDVQAFVTIIELATLGGRNRLDVPVSSLLVYDA